MRINQMNMDTKIGLFPDFYNRRDCLHSIFQFTEMLIHKIRSLFFKRCRIEILHQPYLCEKRM
jgi:hypothetical protein